MASATISLCSSLTSNCRISHSLTPMPSPPILFPQCNHSSPKRTLSFSSSIPQSRTALLPLLKSTESETAVLDFASISSAPAAIQTVEAPPRSSYQARGSVFCSYDWISSIYSYSRTLYLYSELRRLKDAKVNDKIILSKVLLVGTKTSTYIGKPVVTNAAVHAVVEEQGLDKKVIVFKYKKKKNYRRNIGHRQPNSRIRITAISGYQDYPAVTLDS